MPQHFTYSNAHSLDLCQGDVLEKTPELMDVLKQWHPYFYTNSEYKYFIVLTQSCDLVRRNSGECNSRYITIAAVRSFDNFLRRSLESLRIDYIGELWMLDEKYKLNLEQFLIKLMNNNQPGFFFLCEEPTFDFTEPMVATLLVSVALKSDEHYQLCRDAKRLELADAFKAKLGWLLGQQFSRVGTPDWDSENRADELRARISFIIDNNFYTANTAKIKEVKRIIKTEDVDVENIDALKNVFDTCQTQTTKDKFEIALRKLRDGNMQYFNRNSNTDDFIAKVVNSPVISTLL